MTGQEDPKVTPPGRGPAFQLATLALVVVSLSATGFLMLRFMQAPDSALGSGGAAAAAAPASQRLFQFWPKNRPPDLVLILSGETYSYLQPCGCSRPQYGGLARRYNFIQGLV